MNIIGIDVGGTKILGLRASEAGKIAAKIRVATHGSEGLDAVIDRIADLIRDLTPEGGVDAIGVGIPAPVNAERGMVYNPPNLPGWETVPLRRELQSRLELPAGVPIVLVNDANAAALAEFRFGAGSPAKAGGEISHMVYLTVSTGVGGGVVSNGKLLLGATGIAAELGHITLDPDGPRCYCGGIGCFEAMASGTALGREGSVVVASRRDTAMADAVKGNAAKVTAEVVANAARDGDHEACKLMEREGLLVGAGVVSCIHAFNPQLVVIGGGVSRAGDLLFDKVRAVVADRVMPPFRDTYRIVPAALKGESGALGAVAAALEKL